MEILSSPQSADKEITTLHYRASSICDLLNSKGQVIEYSRSRCSPQYSTARFFFGEYFLPLNRIHMRRGETHEVTVVIPHVSHDPDKDRKGSGLLTVSDDTGCVEMGIMTQGGNRLLSSIGIRLYPKSLTGLWQRRDIIVAASYKTAGSDRFTIISINNRLIKEENDLDSLISEFFKKQATRPAISF